MSRSALAKSKALDDQVMAAAARLRSRVLALLHGALRESGLTQSALAGRLGLRKAAVGAVFHGNGNVRISTLAEYLGAMGYEADVALVERGEIERAASEMRSPLRLAVTLRDRHRGESISLPRDYTLLAVHDDPARHVLLAAFHNAERQDENAEREPMALSILGHTENAARTDTAAIFRRKGLPS